MRRTLVILFFLAGLATAPLLAQGIDPAQEQYVNAFLNSRKAEELEAANDLRGALRAYRTVAEILTALKQGNPNYQTEMVDWRLKRTRAAIDRLQGQVGAAGAAEPAPAPAGDPGVLPPLPPDETVGAAVEEPAPRRIPRNPELARQPDDTEVDLKDPLAAVKKKIADLENRLSTANEQLAEEQAKNAQLTQDLTEAIKSRTKAEADRKKAQDLADVYQKSVLELKNKGDTTGERARELEAQLSLAKKQNTEREADLRAAEERIEQLLARSRAVTKKAVEAGNLPKEVKTLQEKLAEEQKEKDAIGAKLAGITKERDDARAEITRLKDLNKQADKLMEENKTLLTKLADAEKQVLAFKADAPKKDQEIASLRTQVTDAQKALAASQERNTTLETELGNVQKRVDEYTKQIQEYKTDKTASVEEKRKMEEENKMLQSIVMRVLQEDANRASRRKIVQKELDRLQVQSDVLLKQIGYLTQPVVNLTSQERRLFKRPVLEVQDPNTLVAIKTEGNLAPPAAPPAPAPAPAPAPEEKPPAAEPQNPDFASNSEESNPPPESPLPPLSPSETAPENPPMETAKLTDPPKSISDLPNDPAPEAAAPTEPATPPAPGPLGNIGRVLPDDIKPLAEQAKLAFDREKYADSEKLYDKALQAAPTNLYLLSNKAVVQFRMGKLKQAEETFRKALAIAPEDHFCWGTLGIVQYSQNKYDEAVNSLTKSLAINPKNPTAHNYLGITAAQKGWIEAAEKELLTATQLDPKYADAWFNLAVTHTLKRPPNKEEARKAYKKALEHGAEPDPSMEDSLK